MNEQPTWRIWIALWILLVLQTTWLSRVEVFGAHLDLALLATVAVALSLGFETGAVFGLVAGIFTGFLAGESVGSYALSRLAVGTAFGLFDRRFSRDNPLAPPLCAAAATLLAGMVFVAFSPTSFSPSGWPLRVASSVVLHALLVWPIYWLINKFVPPPRAMI